MTVALILIAALVVTGTLLYAHDRYSRRHRSGDSGSDNSQSPTAPGADGPDGAQDEGSDDSSRPEGEVCCGMHLNCEKDSLSVTDDTIIYYDDEELDQYAGVDPTTYTPEDIERFRDVLLTLIPTDIAPWAKSLQLRHIAMPAEVRDELLLIISEARAAQA